MNINNLIDETLVCVDCHKPFLFTGGERRFYADKKLQFPKRCPACRAKRKASIDSGFGKVVSDAGS